MLRPIPSLLALCAAMLVAAPSIAADPNGYWGNDGSDMGDTGGAGLRNGYPVEPGDWAGLGDKDDPLRLEFGVRYWYSMGAADWSDLAGHFTATDTSHIGEAHLRIEDHSTDTYASAIGGYAFKLDGTFDDPNDTGSISGGHIGYLGADIGWNSWGNHNGSGIGPLVGYMYWNDSPNTTRSGFTTAESASDITFDPTTGATGVPLDSKPNNIDIHMLRLGVQGKGDLGFADITGSLAAVPYAKVNGVLGNDATSTTYTGGLGNIDTIKASETTLDGWGYGAMADVMLRMHPTQNWTIGIGGRAWYLQGTADATYATATIGDPSDSDAVNPPNYDTGPGFNKQYFIEPANPFALMRFGLLAEITYSF
ncbi:MAG: hypothetical protein ABI697_12225 [Devosia sp.]